jgi:arsenical pump membrane protein
VLIVHAILAAVAVGASAGRGRAALAVLVAAAALDVALGAALGPALTTVLPLAVFLTVALSLAAVVQRSGLCDRAAGALARAARGRSLRLYVLVCVACAALTAVVSLDGAVVLMVPLVLALHRRHGAPFAPLFVAVVVVANTVSLAVPTGNPTNVVLMQQLGLSPGAYLSHLLLPGLAAAAACVLGVALWHRTALGARFTAPAVPVAAGPAPTARRRVVVPWELLVRIAALVVVVDAVPLAAVPAAPALLVAAGVGLAAAAVNNLPASVWAASLLAGPVAYAASIGLAVGALATPRGSVATEIAADLGGHRELLSARRLAPLAAVGVVVACLLL